MNTCVYRLDKIPVFHQGSAIVCQLANYLHVVIFIPDIIVNNQIYKSRKV